MSTETLSPFIQGWLASEDAAHDCLNVRRIYVDICQGDLHAAHLLTQILYYSLPTKVGKTLLVARDGYLWLAKRYEDWWDECRVNANTARKKIALLEELGLIHTAVFKCNGDPIKHIRVDLGVLETLLKNYIDMKTITDKNLL